jgi:hypothetical protein
MIEMNMRNEHEKGIVIDHRETERGWYRNRDGLK